jgi:soluble lytic murein transglycosylase-like protein
MTPRILLTLVGTLMMFGVGAGSCQQIDGSATVNALPHVGAPPPGFEATNAADETAWRHVAVETQVDASGEPYTAGAIAAYLTSRHTGLSKLEIRRLAAAIISEALRHGVEPGLVLAVIQVESNGYHRAVSPVGALGLMQILPSTARELASKHGIVWHGDETLFDPIVNVKLGTAYLKQLADRYDHVPTALAAYNWGPGRIDRRLRNGKDLPEIYVNRVMRAYDGVGGHLALHTSSS